MSLTLEQSDKKFDGVIDHLESELASMRAGRATPQMLDSIKIEAYGQPMPLNQVANITVVDATLMTVKPWDKTNVQPIADAITSSDLGINPSIDGELIRLPIPALTEERRKEYVKLMKDKVEEARIAVRQIRKDVLDTFDEQLEKKQITEDDKERLEKDLQKTVDSYNEKIETIGSDKEEELLQV